MHWTSFFDKIYLINLPIRPHRLCVSKAQLDFNEIPFEVIPAISHADGAKGIYATLLRLFKECVENKSGPILVFEDDFKFLCPVERVMQSCIEQLPKGWRQLYLGANLPNPHMVSLYSGNLFLTKRALALHAVAYSLEMMEMILSLPVMPPIDLQITNFCHDKEIYCTYPLLATQWPGHSDINNKWEDYTHFIDDRYEEVIKHLKISV